MIRTPVQVLKDMPYFKRLQSGENTLRWGCIFSQATNSYQIYLTKDNYYLEVGTDMRGGIPEKDKGGCVFDVASAPQSPEDLKDCLLLVAVEKFMSDLNSIDTILDIMKKEKGIDSTEVSEEDAIKKIKQYFNGRISTIFDDEKVENA